MKNTIKFAVAVFAALFAASFANAQTPYATTGNAGNAGAVNLSVNVKSASDLRTGGVPTSAGGADVLSASNENNALVVSLQFNDASPNQTDVMAAAPFMTATVPIRMRSNDSYQVFAYRAGTMNNTAAEDFLASDVGFGVIDVVRTGSLVAGGSDTVEPGFGSDPASAAVSNGEVSYSKSLADLDIVSTSSAPNTGTKIMSGDRISLGGDNTTTNNYISANLKFAVKPQYYTPTSSAISETISVYILTP